MSPLLAPGKGLPRERPTHITRGESGLIVVWQRGQTDELPRSDVRSWSKVKAAWSRQSPGVEPPWTPAPGDSWKDVVEKLLEDIPLSGHGDALRSAAAWVDHAIAAGDLASDKRLLEKTLKCSRTLRTIADQLD